MLHAENQSREASLTILLELATQVLYGLHRYKICAIYSSIGCSRLSAVSVLKH